MHDPIREALKNAYKEQTFSQQKKQEIMTTIHNKRKKWMPFIATMIVTCSVILFMFTLISKSNTELEISLSSIKAPDSVEVAYMERWHEFLAVASSEQKEQASIQYLSKSDWLLQRAIESGHSSFYSSPPLTADEKLALNELLHYMYLSVKKPNVTLDIPQVQTFQQLKDLAPELVEKMRVSDNDRYVSSSEEMQRSKLRIFYLQPMEIIGQLLFLGAFIYLLYSNWKGRRNYFFAAIQISVICLLLVAMFIPKSGKYAYDETTLLQQSIATFDEPTIEQANAKFSSAATFGDERYVLVDLGNGINGLAHFSKNERGYAWSSSQWGKQDIFQELGDNGRVIAFQEGHGVSHIDIVESDTQRKISLNLNPDKAGIYRIQIPNDFRSFEVKFFNKNGERMH